MDQLGIALAENALPLALRHVEGNDARWFAVYTNSRHEKCVARHFDERQIESFLPLYQKLHHWTKHPNVRLDLPLFPNYVFVHIAPPQRTSVLAVPGVLGMVGRGNIASSLPDVEIESLRNGLQLGKFEPHPYLVAGERVRIKAGSMEGMEGILLRKKNELRVVLTLDLIKRSVHEQWQSDRQHRGPHGPGDSVLVQLLDLSEKHPAIHLQAQHGQQGFCSPRRGMAGLQPAP